MENSNYAISNFSWMNYLNLGKCTQKEVSVGSNKIHGDISTGIR